MFSNLSYSSRLIIAIIGTISISLGTNVGGLFLILSFLGGFLIGGLA